MNASDLPRERLVSSGSSALSDAELVAIHLGTGVAGTSALTLARTLLADWGGLHGLARADVGELSRSRGVGAAKACRLVAAFALAGRSMVDDSLEVRSSADIAAVALPRIGRSRIEQVLVVVLDGGHRVRRVVTVAHGGATSSLVPVREVLATVLRHDGVAFAVAHNHPGGSVEPSPDDLAVTRRLRDAAAEVGLRFLDHVVVAGDRWRGISASR